MYFHFIYGQNFGNMINWWEEKIST